MPEDRYGVKDFFPRNEIFFVSLLRRVQSWQPALENVHRETQPQFALRARRHQQPLIDKRGKHVSRLPSLIAGQVRRGAAFKLGYESIAVISDIFLPM
jgi:hypothetical protein